MSLRVTLAGGGTAGHIEPALAVAAAIKKMEPDAHCLFLGTESGLENLLIPKAGYELRFLPKVPLPRRLALSTFLFPFRALQSIIKARHAIKGSDIIIGFGGYVSAPAYIAARSMRIPIAIHEANAQPGWANRMARSWARVVAVTFEEVRDMWAGSILTGIPLRESLFAIPAMNNQQRKEFRELQCKSWGFDANRPVVAIFGGSQGSAHMNEVVAKFLTEGVNSSSVQIVHAVGVNNPLPKAQPGYHPLPYFHDMTAIYGSCDIAITRSGAVTCAELATVGSYSILIPLPHGNGEQVTNAASLVKQGRAVAVADCDFDAQWLEKNLPGALDAARSLGRMPSALHQGAAERIAELSLTAIRS